MLVKKILEDKLLFSIDSIIPLSGGDINEVFKINVHKGEQYVVKFNSKTKFPDMFRKEVNGLDLLGNRVTTPKVRACFEKGQHQVLVLEYFEETQKNQVFWVDFADSLIQLHQQSHQFFGLKESNFIGSLHQDNTQCERWSEFFINRRLNPMIKMAFDKGLLVQKHLSMFARFFSVYEELVPSEPPALLHGDLWSGNVLCAMGGKAVFIDPAVYYGHREMDLAMTRMFGGFSTSYFDRYKECFPIEKGIEQRIPIHNLYPNLVHLNLFGASYLGNILQVIQPFY